jgi:hypothetical protein
MRARSSATRTGLLLAGEAGTGWAGLNTPPDMWFAGDTGQGRPVFLRAHRLVEDGRMVTVRIGRTIVHGGAAAQYWRSVSRFQVAPAVFVDAVHLDRRAVPGTRDDVDIGAGLRLAGLGGGVCASTWPGGCGTATCACPPDSSRECRPGRGMTGATATACAGFSDCCVSCV